MRTLRFHILPLALALFLSLLFAPTAFAGSGKAIVPTAVTKYTNHLNYTKLRLDISNISENTVEVTLTLRDENGAYVYEHGTNTATSGDLLANYFSPTTYSGADDSADGFTMNFELEGKKSCALTYYPKTEATGNRTIVYGTIEWENAESTENDQVALIASGHRIHHYTPEESDGPQDDINLREIMQDHPINNGIVF
jgi:hypothetical protein